MGAICYGIGLFYVTKYGGNLDHEQTIRNLLNVISASQFSNDFDNRHFVIEWVKRDLLNIAFGNSDNHGRNTAFYVMIIVFGYPYL
ncbi:Uncharacterized protein related to capsule biosynthesis enzymes [Actinobacillus equuli]|nr:Uncharacterized protein related to capsule biosynthesis enzymes [Actinobacillus equuli]